MATATITVGRVRAAFIDGTADRSRTLDAAYNEGVRQYALDLLEDWPDDMPLQVATAETVLRNGADSWHEYAQGSSLVYDEDIALRLCSPEELKRTHAGNLPPDENYTWLDLQERAIEDAARLILHTVDRMA